MARQYPLNEGGTVTLNASGTGTVSMGPSSTGETWTITKISVTGNSAITTQPVANIYIDSVTDQNFFDGTQTGNQDSSDVDWTILQNGKILAVFSGGQSGARHTLSIFGTQNLP